MDDSNASGDLAPVHRALVEALSVLDAAREYAAAAHLVAAIDTLERRIGLHASERLEASADNPVDTLARRLAEGFGARAQAVARRQLATATGPAFLAWAAIVNSIPG